MASSEAIVLENQKQGNPESDWGLAFGQPVGNIEGYAKEFSVNRGDTVEFKINTDANNYQIQIYRLGYYDGDGARLVGTIDHNGGLAPIQPAPFRDASTGLVDAGNWSVTDAWDMPSDLISGVYLAKLVRTDGTFGESRIPFIVRDDSGTSDIIFQTSDTTWQAYNPWGDNSLYLTHAGINGPDKAVSYNRPWALDVPEPTGTPLYGPESYLFGAEYAAIRWLEKNGYDVSYQSGIDTARYGQNLTNHEIFLSVGHDEYWSAEQRANVEAARDAGVNLSFWSANTMFWKTRNDFSITGEPWKTLVTYKESNIGVPPDPSPVWTGLWQDPAGLGEGGGLPQNAVIGQRFGANLGSPLSKIEIPYSLSDSFFWANTDIAFLEPGETWTLNGNYLGYEWDIDVLDEYRPDGQLQLSATAATGRLLQDYPVYEFGPATHNMTLYKADSGAYVFSAGSVFWSWALDDFHVFGPVGPFEATPIDRNAQQAMVNLFAQMGVQPGSLQFDLYFAEKSSDFSAPASSISNLSAGQAVLAGQTLTISGTAQDVGGGVVMGVEVSTDGGISWQPAAGGPNWVYNWVVPNILGPTVVAARAIDDTINIETPFGIPIRILNFETLALETGFDPLEYIASYRDLAEFYGANKDAGASHYFNAGLSEGRFPQFNSLEYIASHNDLAEFYGANKDEGSTHYINSGFAEGRLITFNALEYIASHYDLAQLFGADKNAGSAHYINSGASEGRGAQFDALEYIASYKGLAEFFGVNEDAGSAHFINFGNDEGRFITFDALEYIASYRGLSQLFGADKDAGSTHYINAGASEGRDTSFDALAYIASYQGLLETFGPDRDAGSTHFINLGYNEGRSIDFDASQYLANYQGLQDAFGTDLEAATIHYITNGFYEGREYDQPI